jgi:acyl carrier protein
MSSSNQFLESTITEYISKEIVAKPDLLPLQNDVSLLKGGILDSLSLLKLVMFIEERFRITVNDEELTPDNFETIDKICSFLQSKRTS